MSLSSDSVKMDSDINNSSNIISSGTSKSISSPASQSVFQLSLTSPDGTQQALASATSTQLEAAAEADAKCSKISPPKPRKGEISGRRKEPLLPGYSAMHWQQYMNTINRPPLRKIPLSEINLHNKESDAWTAIRGKVYDITPYLLYHPGGKSQLMKAAGRDGTKLFDSMHSWINVDFMLEKCIIGILGSTSK